MGEERRRGIVGILGYREKQHVCIHRKKGKRKLTSIPRNLGQPLLLDLSILPILAPAINPLLLFLVPLLLVASAVRDAAGGCEFLPLGLGLGLGEGLGAGELVYAGGQLGEGPVGGFCDGEGEEGADERLRPVPRERLEVLFEIVAVYNGLLRILDYILWAQRRAHA